MVQVFIPWHILSPKTPWVSNIRAVYDKHILVGLFYCGEEVDVTIRDHLIFLGDFVYEKHAVKPTALVNLPASHGERPVRIDGTSDISFRYNRRGLKKTLRNASPIKIADSTYEFVKECNPCKILPCKGAYHKTGTRIWDFKNAVSIRKVEPNIIMAGSNIETLGLDIISPGTAVLFGLANIDHPPTPVLFELQLV